MHLQFIFLFWSSMLFQLYHHGDSFKSSQGFACVFNFSFRFDHPFITGVLHEGSTWWFVKDSFHSSIVLQDFSWSYDPPSYTLKLNMVLNTCFLLRRSSILLLAFSKCNSFYLIFWGGVMSFLTISLHASWFTCCQEWGILNPSISSLELSWVIFHLKLSLRIVAIYGAYKWPKFFICPPGEISFSSPCWYQSNHLFPLVAEAHLIILRCFHKPTTSLFFSLLVSQELRSILPCKDALEIQLWWKLSFSSPSLYPNGLASILLLRRHCDIALFDPSSRFVKIIFFPFLSI